MKKLYILLSPSKTQQTKSIAHIHQHGKTKPMFKQESEMLYSRIKDMGVEELGLALGIKGKLRDQAFSLYEQFEAQKSLCAIELYTGSVFKGLRLQAYSREELDYLNHHILIFSAFYGLLRPMDAVKPYRLDMHSKAFPEGSYAFWREKLNQAIDSKAILINLASDEFSKLIDRQMNTIIFCEEDQSGHRSVKSTYAKIARGKMADYAISNQITDPEMFKNYNEDGYRYCERESTQYKWVFVRKG